MKRTVKRACHLCEAICGIEISLENEQIVVIKGDKDDPLSKGHICPKAVALQDLHNDPDRLRKPMVKQNGVFVEASWEQAYQRVVEGLTTAVNNGGANAVGVYAGNPNVHNYGSITHGSQLTAAIRTKNRFSATSVDQLPHQLIAHLMFGHQLLVPIPDIDNSDYFLMLGANPMASNGSLMTVPNFPKRLKALQARGGKLVVLDPRRTETAEKADQHHFIRPGGDAAFLAAIVHVLYAEGLVNIGHLEQSSDGIAELADLFAGFTPEAVQSETGIAADTIREIARDFAAAERAVCYGRMGCSTQRFGTLCQWLTQIINLLTGNLDAVGGAMFTQPAADMIATGMSKPGHFNAWQSRVSQLPEFSGELPAAAMVEEMTTEGEGQVKAMVTIAGNPVLSVPGGESLDQAFANVDFMVSVDIYLNETTRHADVILPPTSPLEHDHYDLIFQHFAVRNTAKYSQPVFDKPEGTKHDWEIFTELGEQLALALGKDARPSIPPDQIVAMALKAGGHGIDLQQLKEQPSGIDIGPLQTCLTERIFTENKRIQCVPEVIPPELQRLEQQLSSGGVDTSRGLGKLILIGRRNVRSNNSWMHNHQRLIKGKPRCTMLINPEDAQALKLTDGQLATVQTEQGALTIAAEIDDGMMPGTISIPHGFGHDKAGSQLSIAEQNAGVNVNALISAKELDALSGNAAVNGVSVTVAVA